MGEREILVTQCLLLPTRTHHSCTTHTVSLKGGGAWERVRWVDERKTLVVVTQRLLLPTRTHHCYTTHIVPYNITLTISPLPLPWHAWGSGELA